MRWNPLRAALFAGAIYDILVGLAIVFALRGLSQILPIPFPAEPLYARLCGVLLAGLGALYGAAAVTIPFSMASIYVAIAIRAAGGLFLLIVPFFDESIARFFAVFGAVDLFFGLWTYIALRICQNRIV